MSPQVVLLLSGLLGHARCNNPLFPDAMVVQYADLMATTRNAPMPAFVPIPGGELINLTDHIHRTITSLGSNGVKKQRSRMPYEACSITLNSVSVSNSIALGSGFALGSGGAFYATNSYVWISGGTYSKNTALFGGSISLVDSRVMLQGVAFEDSLAYQMAGALLVAYSVDKQATAMSQVFLGSCTFTNCESNEFHGAASFSRVEDLFMTGCEFKECKAGQSGGAIGITDSYSYLMSTKFIGNKCETKEVFYYVKGSTKERLGIARGGGAIMFHSVAHRPQNRSHSEPLIDLVTQGCCFTGNSAFNNPTLDYVGGSFQGFGHDILFSGRCFWRSYTDKFVRNQQSAIGHVARSTDPDVDISQWTLNIFTSDSTRSSTFGQASSVCGTGNVRSNSETAVTQALGTITAMAESNIGKPAVPVPTFMRTYTPLPTRVPYRTSNPTRSQTPSRTFTYSITPSKIQSATPSMTRSPTRSSYLDSVPTATPDNARTKGVTASYMWEVPSTATVSVTSNGATWPLQSTTAVIVTRTPTRSSFGEIPPPTPTSSLSPSKSMLWEIPDPTATASISFQFEPISTATASRTASGATWPLQSTTSHLLTRTPTRSSYGEKPPAATPVASKSSLWEIPDPTATASISFQFEPISTATASKTAEGATWPLQSTTAVVVTRTPTRSSFGEVPPPTPTSSISASVSSLWEIPDPTASVSISFQFEPISTATASKTAEGATWPLQSTTSHLLTRTPTRSSYGEKPPAATPAASKSSLWEIPDPTATVSISFQFEPISTATASRTASGATWPLQSTTANTPTASSFGEVISISVPTQSSLWEIPDPTASVSISFQFDPSASMSPTPSQSSIPSLKSDQSFVSTYTQIVVPSFSQVTVVSIESDYLPVSSLTVDEYNQESETVSYSIFTWITVSYSYIYSQFSTVILILDIHEVYKSTDPPMSTGLIIGLATGAAFFVLIIALAVVFIVRNRAQEDDSQYSETDDKSGSSNHVINPAPDPDEPSVQLEESDDMWL